MRQLFLLMIFSFSLIALWGEWQKQNSPQPILAGQETTLPTKKVTQNTEERKAEAISKDETRTLAEKGQPVFVNTDMFDIVINTRGATIEKVDLKHHKDSFDKTRDLRLLTTGDEHTYIAQSGLIGEDLPNHNTIFTTDKQKYSLDETKDVLEVTFVKTNKSGITVKKTFKFHRNNSFIDLKTEVVNNTNDQLEASPYYQLVRDANPLEDESKFVPTFTGPAVYDEADKFKKIAFSDIDSNKTGLKTEYKDGWIAMLQHYFISAWIPEKGSNRENFVKKLDENLYAVGLIGSTVSVLSKQTANITTQFYVGPAQTKLNETVPGLGLTVDYGWLTVFSSPLFWVMTQLNQIVENWGVAIILLTILIKLVFFPLSAASYRSMAKMRTVAPKLEQIKKQYGDDREKLNRAMMDLYKTEKINPLGGCLPMLIQIPVFIALYWAILSSVELRHAPFFGWIHDLSATDPYFVLPVIMGLSMLVQSKLNPVPQDPMQAKLMQTMPIVFSVVFFFFPAGLVLYSIVNNILSIAQQWYITRNIETETKIASQK